MTEQSKPMTSPRAWMGAVGLLAAFAFVQCTPTIEVPEPPEDPVAVITILADSHVIQLGESISLDGSASSLGANTEDLGLTLSYFWRIDSRPIDSLLIDESLTPGEAPAETGDDDDDTAEPADDDDSEDPSDDDDAGDVAPGDNAIVTLTPDVQGLYGITLQVGDGERVSDVVHAVIQVGGGNTCPVANAGVDLVAQTGVPITLDGSGTTDPDVEDPEAEEDGQTLLYNWRFSLLPGDSLLDDSDIYHQGTANPVIIPDVPGTYILQLRADDGLCTSLPDYVTVQASNGNQLPIADAGQSIILTPCSPSEVSLDGTASFDPEGQALEFAWSFTSVPTGSGVSDAFLDGRFTSTPAFNWDVPGIYTLELLVSDEEGSSEPDYVAVQAVPSLPNGEPTAFAGDDLVIEASAACTSDPYGGGACNPCGTRSVVLTASGSLDPDGDQLNYQWELQTGEAEILGTESETLEVELDPVPVSFGGTATSTVQIGLTVFDCRAADATTVTINYVCQGF